MGGEVDEATWVLIEEERTSLADLLATLTDDQWQTPSLCAEWRVRDVAAHVAMTPVAEPSLGGLLTALVANRGHLWAAGRDVAIAYAQRPTDQLVTELRSTASLRTKPVFVWAPNILLDLVVHGQDSAVPLGITRRVPPPAGRTSLRRLWNMGWPFHARRRWGELSIRADDCDWSAGQGPLLTGSAADLLLLMTGRSVAVHRFLGPGVEVVRRRVVPPNHHARDKEQRQP